jgi:hypothetical protein
MEFNAEITCKCILVPLDDNIAFASVKGSKKGKEQVFCAGTQRRTSFFISAEVHTSLHDCEPEGIE